MILHLVLFRFKPGATPEQLAAARDALLAMGASIDEIRAIRFGPNLGPTAAAWPYVLAVELDDMAAVQRYADHPVHREAVDRLVLPIRADRLAIDVEIPAQ